MIIHMFFFHVVLKALYVCTCLCTHAFIIYIHVHSTYSIIVTVMLDRQTSIIYVIQIVSSLNSTWPLKRMHILQSQQSSVNPDYEFFEVLRAGNGSGIWLPTFAIEAQKARTRRRKSESRGKDVIKIYCMRKIKKTGNNARPEGSEECWEMLCFDSWTHGLTTSVITCTRARLRTTLVWTEGQHTWGPWGTHKAPPLTEELLTVDSC